MKHKLTYMLAVVVALVGALWGSSIVPAFAQATTVEVSAAVRDAQGNAVNPADVIVGDRFFVDVSCTDTAANQPVFSCFADHTFDESIVQVQGITYSANFPNFQGAKLGESGPAGNYDNANGTITSAGAVNNINPNVNTQVYTVEFLAVGTGTFDLTTSETDSGSRVFAETTIYNNPSEEDDQRGGNVTYPGAVAFTVSPPPPLMVQGNSTNASPNSFDPRTLIAIRYNQDVVLGANGIENGAIIREFVNGNPNPQFRNFLQPQDSRFVTRATSRNDQLNLDFKDILQFGRDYQIEIRPGFGLREGDSGQIENPYIFNFSTIDSDLQVQGVAPRDGTTDFDPSNLLAVRYNQDIVLGENTRSSDVVLKSGVVLREVTSSGLRYIGFLQPNDARFVTRSTARSDQLNLNFINLVEAGKTYQVEIRTATVLSADDGYALNQPFVWSFTTAGATTMASNERTREESSAFSLQASASTVIEESQRQSSGDAASTGALTLPAVASEFETVGPWTADESGWTIAGVEDTAALTWTQPVDLSGATSPALTFDGTLATTRSSAAVQVSTGDDAWSTVAVLQPGAGEQSIDLSSFVGSAVNVRFVWVGYGGEDTWTVSGVSIAEAPVTEEAPVEEVATEEAPAEEAPVEEVVTEEAPVEEVATEEAPAEEVVTEEAPVEEAPVEEAPAEETATEEVEAIEMDAPVSEGSFE